MSTIVNKGPLLRQSRDFPNDPERLLEELQKMYTEISGATNNRTIGIFPTNGSSPTGETWYPGAPSQSQQGFRQIYNFTASGNIPHGINLINISQFTKAGGSFTDGTNYYGVIYGSNTAIAGQVSFYITGTNIVVLAGAGAPSITKGLIYVEWIAEA